MARPPAEARGAPAARRLPVPPGYWIAVPAVPCREPAAVPGSPARLVGPRPQVAQVVDRRAVPVEARLPAEWAQAEPEAGRCAEPVAFASAELPRAAEHGARPAAAELAVVEPAAPSFVAARVPSLARAPAAVRLPAAELAGAERAAPSSVAAHAPSHVHAPAAARLVLPEVSARRAQVSPLAAAYGAQLLAAEETVLPDAAVAQAAAPPDAAAEVVVLDVAAAAEAEPGVAVAAVVLAVRAERPSVLPWAAASASRPDPVLPWPAPPRSGPIVRAMELSPTAWRSTRSWQAARVVVLSCALGSREVLKADRQIGFSKIAVELNQQRPAINRHALGRIVAGFERGRVFICRNCAVWTRSCS